MRSRPIWLLDKILTIRSGLNEAYFLENYFIEEFPELKNDASAYGQLINKYNFNFDERLALILSLAVHLYPKMFDSFKLPVIPTSFGGVIGKSHRGFIPTGETLMYILAGSNISKRLDLLYLFDKNHVFYRENLLSLEPSSPSEPELSGILTASPDLIDLVLRGKVRKPDLRHDFPAKLLSTEMNWDDMVLLIINIVSYCTLKAMNEKSGVITPGMLQDGIARELAKESRTL